MELLVHHKLESAVQRRFVELRQPRGERQENQQRQARQLAEIVELVEVLGVSFRPDEVANCVERLRMAPTTVVREDKQVVVARAGAHEAICVHEASAPEVFVAPGIGSRAHACVDEAFDLLNNLRKPSVVALAAVTLALRGQTVTSMRSGEGTHSIYAGIG
jgi:hypothetical protein